MKTKPAVTYTKNANGFYKVTVHDWAAAIREAIARKTK